MSCKRASRFHRWGHALAALVASVAMLGLSAGNGSAEGERLRVHGSTTFHSLLLEPHQHRIEDRAGVRLEIVASKSIWGLTALLEGRADVALISADLAGERSALSKQAPSLATGALQAFEIVRARVALAIHASNPVRRISLSELSQILKGEIRNWKALGGPDLPIRLVMVREGGGTLVAVRSHTIGDAPLTAPGMVRLESPRHVLTVVAQEPGAIGIAQLKLLRQAGLPELMTDVPIEQRLNIVTNGEPSAPVRRLIDAVRSVAADHLM